MILGAAQVVINVERLEDAERDLAEAGYAATFREASLANHPAKEPFQARPRTQLAMSHFTPPSPGMAVELTAYAGDAPAGAAPYELVRRDGLVEAVRVRCAEPDASRAFWNAGLGFRDGGGALEFAAISAAWRLRVVLEPRDDPAPATSVDAPGCVLVTMLSTDLARDLATLAAEQPLGRSTEPWTERVGGRDVTVAVIEGPSGELVELLQPPRT